MNSQTPTHGAQINENRLSITRLEVGVIFSIVVSAASLIFSAGVIWTTVQIHDKEIATLQTSSNQSVDRLARIETGLNFLVEQSKIENERHFKP